MHGNRAVADSSGVESDHRDGDEFCAPAVEICPNAVCVHVSCFSVAEMISL